MPRKPLGTYVRTTSDWFTATSGSTGTFHELTSGTVIDALSLYNADQHGRVVLINAIDIISPNQTTFGYQAFGVDGGIQDTGQQLVSGNPVSTAQLWWYEATTQPPLFPKGGFAFRYFFPAAQSQPYAIRSRGPIALLKPGWSFAVALNVKGTTQLGVNFFYTVLDSE